MPDRESLVVAERALQAAQLASDVEALGELLHDELVFVSPGGILVGKADDLELHASGAIRFHDSREAELDARVRGDEGETYALIELDVETGGERVQGTYRYLRVWTWDSGRWQVISGSVVPFTLQTG